MIRIKSNMNINSNRMIAWNPHYYQMIWAVAFVVAAAVLVGAAADVAVVGRDLFYHWFAADSIGVDSLFFVHLTHAVSVVNFAVSPDAIHCHRRCQKHQPDRRHRDLSAMLTFDTSETVMVTVVLHRWCLNHQKSSPAIAHCKRIDHLIVLQLLQPIDLKSHWDQHAVEMVRTVHVPAQSVGHQNYSVCPHSSVSLCLFQPETTKQFTVSYYFIIQQSLSAAKQFRHNKKNCK